ncbi:MAG: hypothetical protein DWQ02_18400 [Bacteroidetes bacterium]|nr:MAG: hypothetical protein DWQ02_18400 [Bacteroidota bacterium]
MRRVDLLLRPNYKSYKHISVKVTSLNEQPFLFFGRYALGIRGQIRKINARGMAYYCMARQCLVIKQNKPSSMGTAQLGS